MLRAFCFAIFILACTSPISAAPEIDLPYSKFKLDNGLTVVIHEDKKAPIVAVNIWYHVGSKDEKEGRTGFAHLFEHLMFNGSENSNVDWFKPLESLGATGINGTTSQDRTNYFQIVPKNALEATLWLESDRMGHLIGAIDQAKLDEQRAVVQNEKRQGENQPYGRVFETILKNVYPAGHPYSWSVIGSMEDLNAATVDDVHQWFKTKYGAANATLVLAGDISPEEGKLLAEKYFSHIDSGPPQTKQTSWIAKRTGKRSQTMMDRVPQARIYKVWNIPEWGSTDATYLSAASDVLSSGKKARLYNRLVYDERVASDVSAFSFNSEIGGLFGIVATALTPEKLDYIDQAIDEEMRTFFKKGPSSSELKRVKTKRRANFIRGIERVSTKASLLAKHQVFADDPGFYKQRYERYQNATTKQIINASKKWLSDGEYSLRVLPFGNHSSQPSQVDRSQGMPNVGAAPTVSFDKLEKTTLSNGLKVILANRSTVPAVSMQLIFDAGFAADKGFKSGTASLTMAMLDEGNDKLDALEINSKLAELGTSIGSGASLDSSIISLNTLKENLEPSISLFSDIILKPSFPENELSRLKQQRIAGISQEKSSAFGAGFRILPKLIYGEGHAYAAPFSGSGNEKSIASIEVSDLRRYHQTWFKANNATLIVSGDINIDELTPLAEKYLGQLPTGNTPTKDIALPLPIEKTTVYLLDRPDSKQSAIIAASMLPKYGFDGELPLQLMNEVLGASFNSRINTNLREDKGWSYGARSTISSTQAERPFIIHAPVQSDKTVESIVEIHKELEAIRNEKPATQSELDRSLDKRILTLPGRWETARSVASDIATLVTYGLDETYWDTYVQKLQSITLDQVNHSAKTYIKPDALLWLIIGDLTEIEPAIRESNIGKIVIIDENGNIAE